MSHEITYDYLESPIGLVEVGGTARAVTTVLFVERRQHEGRPSSVVTLALSQLGEYFTSQRRHFDIPLDLIGTDFQREVWTHLLSVSYACTATYADVAAAIGRPQAVRAVGAANGRNPISLIVPCHRIIGSNGKLTGYGGGLWRKEWLLRHEGTLLL